MLILLYRAKYFTCVFSMYCYVVERHTAIRDGQDRVTVLLLE